MDSFNNDSHYFKAESTIEEVIKHLNHPETSEILKGMKKVVAMMSKGKEVEILFPNVVTKVVVKNLQVKKLVYTYLMQYAEFRPDEALLSVNNFQKDLNDKNQFIRALALRVLSGIRVGEISQIVLMAIKQCADDVSPYVRKAACVAAAKVYNLEPELKSELVEIVAKKLGDNNIMVLGAAIFAFNEICPDSFELLHEHYRKLCKFLVDCDEWCQILLINTLTRYGRNQFLSPFKEGGALKKQNFYSDEEEEEEEEFFDKKQDNLSIVDLDFDHRLLLKSAEPLLKNRNSAVTMAVVSLFYHLAPVEEFGTVITSLLRILREEREYQYVALTNIVTMAKERPSVFKSEIKDFFVSSSDPAFIAPLKLEILTLLTDESNAHVILKEFRSYVKYPNANFVSTTIQAIGRIASNIPEETEGCLNLLVSLINSSSTTEAIVAESVVVIRHLVHTNPKENEKIIRKMSKMVKKENITPIARASIIWMIGEYYDLIPKIGPDALRMLAKSFPDEPDLVKTQIILTATKLFLRKAKGVKLIFKYILNLAKFDQNYDIRDRARLIRLALFHPQNENENIKEKARDLFVTKKPNPIFKSVIPDRSKYTIASLSHILNLTANDYHALDEFTNEINEENVALRKKNDIQQTTTETQYYEPEQNIEDFYSDGENGDFDVSTDEEDEESSFFSTDEEDESEEDETDSEEEEEEEEEEGSEAITESEEEESEEEEEEEEHSEFTEEEESEYETESDEEEVVQSKPVKKSNGKTTPKTTPSNTINLDEMFSNLTLEPSSGGNDLLSNDNNSSDDFFSSSTPTSNYVENTNLPKYSLLNPLKTGGFGIDFQFTRDQTSFYGANFNLIKLILQNNSNVSIKNIRLGEIKSSNGRTIEKFPEIAELKVGVVQAVDLNVDFNANRGELKFEILTENKEYIVSMTPPPGELFKQFQMSKDEFDSEKEKLKGMMTEVEQKISKPIDDNYIVSSIIQYFNLSVVDNFDSEFLFSAKTKSKDDPKLVLISFKKNEEGEGLLTVNCDDNMLISVLSGDLVQILTAQ